MGLTLPIAGFKITSGSYVGDNTANRAIAHSLSAVPKYIIIWDSTYQGTWQWWIIPSAADVIATRGTAGSTNKYTVTAADATNFYVGNAANYFNSGNGSASTWFWVAVG